MEQLAIKRALLSVTDKTGLNELGIFLVEHGVELVSTGGTCAFLESEGLPVTKVSSVTNFPEILGGRVKTLHPHIHGGILADKDNAEHMQSLDELSIKSFDLICVNLYDFAGAVERKLSLLQAVEEIDIGGPCMLRAAAKNYHSVLVLPAPNCYVEGMSEMRKNKMHVGLEIRKTMAIRTFEATSRYDALVSSYMKELSHS